MGRYRRRRNNVGLRSCGVALESLKTEVRRAADIFPRRIRWLAIVTGTASALALFPILFLLYPALLIAGGYLQPRYPTTGKWFVWAGAANLGVVLIVYDVMMFPHPFRQPEFPAHMVLAFSASTVLLAWCYAELVVDGVRRMRARRSMPPRQARPLALDVWILAVFLNLLLGWVVTGWVLTQATYRDFSDFSRLAMSLALAATIVAFDLSLVGQSVKPRRARRSGRSA